MFKSTVIFLTIILVEECLSVGVITLKRVDLERKGSVRFCEHSTSRVSCLVKGGETVNLTANWNVDGTEAALGVTKLTVALKYSDRDGDHNNIPVCQKTGGKLELDGNPCNFFAVPTGDYDMVPYEIQIPHSGSKVKEELTMWVYSKWSDGSSSSKIVAVFDLTLKK